MMVVPPASLGSTKASRVAYYEGESAVGVNITHRLSAGAEKEDGSRTLLNFGISVTTADTVLTRILVGTEF